MILAQLELANATNEVMWNGDSPVSITLMSFANTTAGALNLRLWVVAADQVLGNKHRYAYDEVIAANARLKFEDDFQLLRSDKIWVYGSASGIVGSIFGQRLG